MEITTQYLDLSQLTDAQRNVLDVCDVDLSENDLMQLKAFITHLIANKPRKDTFRLISKEELERNRTSAYSYRF